MPTLTHPNFYKTGIRVLMLASRKKDGGKNFQKLRVSHSIEEFNSVLDEFEDIACESDRIYASILPRNRQVAIYNFKRAMLESEYTLNFDFFKNINGKWCSALMKPNAQISDPEHGNLWLWDCDSEDEYHECLAVINEYKPSHVYSYFTKNGVHIITSSFNLRTVPSNITDMHKKNAMMLWRF